MLLPSGQVCPVEETNQMSRKTKQKHFGVFIVGASFSIRHHEVFVKRLDFSDPQCGKGPCDRKAASLKTHIRVHLNQRSNIETSKEMVDAIRSSGGVQDHRREFIFQYSELLGRKPNSLEGIWKRTW